MNKLFKSLICCSILIACDSPQEEKHSQKPNILLIVADDLGYADLGSYGGDIDTPNLDLLASEGRRFSQFKAGPSCAVSRSMFLTGNDNHIAGMGKQSHYTEVEGYEGYLSNRVLTIPEVLLKSSYHTYMVGKWHLGPELEHDPSYRGFEKSFMTPEGGANHYNSLGVLPQAPISIYRENGQETTWPEGAYSTDFYTIKIIEYISSNLEDEKPFFAYASYTTPHWPLQVDEEHWQKYVGRYDDGYENLQAKRLESLKKAGIISDKVVLPELSTRVKPWKELSPQQQKKEARKMELYSGMIDNLDKNIGKVISYLKGAGVYENTLIIFLSDNGAAAEDFYYQEPFKELLQANYTDVFEKMGTAESFISYGPQWAEAGTGPFRYFKTYMSEGGIRVPMIISGVGVENIGEIEPAFSTVLDLAPTIYECAGAEYPKNQNGVELKPLLGESMWPILSAEKNHIHTDNYVFGMEHDGNAMIQKGDWKILNYQTPFDKTNFELFNTNNDPSERINLCKTHPKKFDEMLEEWDIWSKKVGVILPTPESKSDF